MLLAVPTEVLLRFSRSGQAIRSTALHGSKFPPAHYLTKMTAGMLRSVV